jgi:hypothetical protein
MHQDVKGTASKTASYQIVLSSHLQQQMHNGRKLDAVRFKLSTYRYKKAGLLTVKCVDPKSSLRSILLLSKASVRAVAALSSSALQLRSSSRSPTLCFKPFARAIQPVHMIQTKLAKTKR